MHKQCIVHRRNCSPCTLYTGISFAMFAISMVGGLFLALRSLSIYRVRMSIPVPNAFPKDRYPTVTCCTRLNTPRPLPMFNPPTRNPETDTLPAKLKRLDLIGSAMFISGALRTDLPDLSSEYTESHKRAAIFFWDYDNLHGPGMR
jgi:hypothetical protein